MKYSVVAVAIFALPIFAQSGNIAVTTGQYNTGRTSANTNEVILTPSNVNVNQFGKLLSWSVDGDIYAQPLYVPGVSVGGVVRNLVIVGTMHNTVYAFDADHPSVNQPLWSNNLGPSVPAPTSNGCPAQGVTGPELGILSTPVADPSTNTLYAISATPSGGGYTHLFHALNLGTGVENPGSPVSVQPSISGNGYNARNGTVYMDASSTEVQRTALLLANGKVYAGFGNCGPDVDPWHGWVLGFNTSNIQSTPLIFNTTPNGGQGGVWQSGRGLVVDSSGDLYFTSGNATVYTTNDSDVTTGSSSADAAAGDYPERFIQLSAGGQFLGSYPPPNYAALNDNDLDFSSSGPLLIPGTNLLVAGGKDGVIYVFNPNNLSSPVQSFQATGTGTCSYSGDGCDQIHDLAFWNSNLYVWGTFDVLRVYHFNSSTSKFNTAPQSQNTITMGYHPAALAVSGNGDQAGIVWAVTPDAVLHAFSASNVASELWNSTMNPGRDGLPSYPKFTEPTVANGRVYVATHSAQLAVYGLLTDFSLTTSTNTLTVLQGSSGALTVSVTALGTFNGPAALSASGLPANASASFNPSSISGSASSTATIKTSSTTPTGTYNVLLTGKGGGETRTASLTLKVTTSDTTPPQWTCCTYTFNPDGSYVMGFSAWDSQSGLKSITVVQQVSATVSIPPFTPGTTSVINFSATESGWSSYVKFQLTDVAGNVSSIDPVLIDPARAPGPPVPDAVKDVTPDEGVITIINQSPGLKNIRIDVNGGMTPGHIEVAGLHDMETRVVNITASLPADGATVTITPLGKPGGSALLIFAGQSMSPQP